MDVRSDEMLPKSATRRRRSGTVLRARQGRRRHRGRATRRATSVSISVRRESTSMQLITPRTEPGPLFDVKLGEILDFLDATGERMKRDEERLSRSRASSRSRPPMFCRAT